MMALCSTLPPNLRRAAGSSRAAPTPVVCCTASPAHRSHSLQAGNEEEDTQHEVGLDRQHRAALEQHLVPAACQAGARALQLQMHSPPASLPSRCLGAWMPAAGGSGEALARRGWAKRRRRRRQPCRAATGPSPLRGRHLLRVEAVGGRFRPSRRAGELGGLGVVAAGLLAGLTRQPQGAVGSLHAHGAAGRAPGLSARGENAGVAQGRLHLGYTFSGLAEGVGGAGRLR